MKFREGTNSDSDYAHCSVRLYRGVPSGVELNSMATYAVAHGLLLLLEYREADGSHLDHDPWAERPIYGRTGNPNTSSAAPLTSRSCA